MEEQIKELIQYQKDKIGQINIAFANFVEEDHKFSHILYLGQEKELRQQFIEDLENILERKFAVIKFDEIIDKF